LPFTGPLSDLSHPQLVRLLNRFTAPGEYNHLLVALRIFFNWALKRRYVTENSTFGLSTHHRPSRSRLLTSDELRQIWEVCSDQGNELSAHFRAIVKLLLVCGQRRGELAAVRREWLDLENKTICLPREICKNSREHTFPLGPIAASLIAEIPPKAGLLFPAR